MPSEDTAQRPDTATREPFRSAHLAGQGNADFDAWFAEHVDLGQPPPPGVPPEPGDGRYVDRGDPLHVWVRDSRHPTHAEFLASDPAVWWSARDEAWCTYAQALADGLDPTRPLVELPDPGADRVAIARVVAEHWRDWALNQAPEGMRWAAHPLALVLSALDGVSDPVDLGVEADSPNAARIRALAEQGCPDVQG